MRLTQAVNPAMEALVFESIVAACEAALNRYPTTEDEDAAIMGDRGMFTALPVNARNAIRLRRTEKRLLKRTIATAERRLVEIQNGGPVPEAKPWLEPKTRFQGIMDEIGVDIR